MNAMISKVFIVSPRAIVITTVALQTEKVRKLSLKSSTRHFPPRHKHLPSLNPLTRWWWRWLEQKKRSEPAMMNNMTMVKTNIKTMVKINDKTMTKINDTTMVKRYMTMVKKMIRIWSRWLEQWLLTAPWLLLQGETGDARGICKAIYWNQYFLGNLLQNPTHSLCVFPIELQFYGGKI